MMTQWLPPHIKPVHVGVYEVDWRDKSSWMVYARWNGNLWSHPSYQKTDEYWHNRYDNAGQTISWRGFTEEQT
jgi:hypothetical protein